MEHLMKNFFNTIERSLVITKEQGTLEDWKAKVTAALKNRLVLILETEDCSIWKGNVFPRVIVMIWWKRDLRYQIFIRLNEGNVGKKLKEGEYGYLYPLNTKG